VDDEELNPSRKVLFKDMSLSKFSKSKKAAKPSSDIIFLIRAG
jgi:hypothetical protein